MSHKMSHEVKVTIEWDGNTAGVHAEPMTVHIAGKADPNKIIGAVAKAMALVKEPEKPKCEDDEFTHILPESKKVTVVCKGSTCTFSSWHEALDFLFSAPAPAAWAIV